MRVVIEYLRKAVFRATRDEEFEIEKIGRGVDSGEQSRKKLPALAIILPGAFVEGIDDDH